MRNVLVAVFGVIVYIAVDAVSKIILGVIFSIPIISQILSWPVEPKWYAFITSIFISAFITYWIVEKLSKRTAYFRNYALIILSVLITTICLTSTILAVNNYGFSFISLAQITPVFSAIFFFYMGCIADKSEVETA